MELFIPPSAPPTPKTPSPLLPNPAQPTYKTSELIALAILSTPGQRATTKQIYRWVSQNFAANASNEEVWQHRIRNGLSRNKAFVKDGKARGQESYWRMAENARYPLNGWGLERLRVKFMGGEIVGDGEERVIEVSSEAMIDSLEGENVDRGIDLAVQEDE